MRKAGGGSTMRRNLKAAKGSARYALEDTAPDKRPSRKSGRRSANHQKAAPTLKGGRVDLQVHSPQRRHERAK
jgi:hypothetical protein